MIANDQYATLRQHEINRAVYNSARVYRHYLSKLLTPSEVACFHKHRSCISGRDVLDIGAGAGRTARYLAPMARRYEAVDYSPVMVSYMKENLPEISVHEADFRDLSLFDDASFDFILATDNVIDALSHHGRLSALDEASRLLRVGGRLAFSSHNIRYRRAFWGPHVVWSWDPLRVAASFVNYVLSWNNHRRVRPMRMTTPEYALLNDPGHRYACLHYYAGRSTVDSQLANAGLHLIEAFDTRGQVILEVQDDSDNPSLLYVAERA